MFNKLAIATAIVLSLAGPAAAQPPTRVELHVPQGKLTHLQIGQSYKTAAVGDTSIADVVPLTDMAVLVEAHKVGITNIVFLDPGNVPIAEATIVVDRSNAGGRFVEIHNKALISSYTEYACTRTGCRFVGENTVSEPAPLPRGWSNSTFNYNMPAAPAAPTPSAPIPQQ